jgi:hypothetical protein
MTWKTSLKREMRPLSSFDLEPFFLLCEAMSSHCTADLNPDFPHESAKISCSLFPDHRRSKRISPLNVLVPCKPAPDVIFTWMSECLIQDRVVQIFEEAQLTGFTTSPARAKSKGAIDDLSVSEFQITGWGGVAAADSGIREVERCDTCGFLRYSAIEEPRKLIDFSCWDGSDFFMIWPLPRYRFVTKRVVEICKRRKLSGVAFESNFPVPSAITGYSPGRLSYYMPTGRAHELGDKLDIY